MSVTVIVFAYRSRLPTTEVLQQTLETHGFRVALDPACDVATHEGFWPATYRERSAGFESCCEPAGGLLEAHPGVPLTCDVAISFVTHADMDEACSAWLTAAVLTQLTDGTLLDEASGEAIAATDALAWGREVEQEANR